jgi:homoserine O-acetyltransferase/O-succinyltransferase
MFGWSVLGQTSFSLDYRVSQPWDVVTKDVFVWEPKGDQGANLISKAAEYDVNDLLCRNQSLSDYDVSPWLNRIKARTLIIHVKNDQWLMYSTAEEAAKQIPGAKLVSFEDPLAHYAVFRGPNVLRKDVEEFLREIGLK